MLQRVREGAGRLGVLVVSTAAAALVASTAAGAAASLNVPCSAGGAGLVAAVNTVNAADGGSINLASGCTYSLTTANNPAVGGNGRVVRSRERIRATGGEVDRPAIGSIDGIHRRNQPSPTRRAWDIQRSRRPGSRRGHQGRRGRRD